VRIRAVLAVLGLILTTGCGSTAPESIVNKSTLVVGVRSDLPLVGWQRDDGSLEGLDVDVARDLAGRLGADLELVPVRAADRESALLTGKVDLVLAVFSITQDRKTRVGFAGPYFLSYQDLLVRRDETAIRTVRDLAGRRLCAVAGSNVPDRIVKEKGVPAVLVPAADYGACVSMLRDRRIDAIATNDVILAGLAHQAGGAVRLLNARYSQERTGVGMRPGDVAGCEAVNRAITEMYQDGTAQRLARTWFGASGIDLSTIAVPQFEGCS
jgi:glutamate transport system substrate-binding protein